MKIVHLVIGGEVAGGQAVALRLARGARARGDEVRFVSQSPGPFVAQLERERMPVEILDLGRTFHLGAARRLKRLLEREGADILHTHTALAANILARVAARLAGVPVVAHMHIENHFRPQRLPRAVHRALDNATARLCARIVVVSEVTRRALERQGYPAERMTVVHNGVDLPPASPGPVQLRGSEPRANGGGWRSELGIPDDAPLVGEVARLCAVKGQRELLGALADLSGKYDDLRVVLVGKDLEQAGAYEALLEREATRLGVRDRVLFAGYEPDAAALIGELDVLALPSWIEGLPLVALEAMAHGKPVVATSVGGTAEAVVDGETGLLVAPRDPAALAAALDRLLGDPELARRLGEAGRLRVESEFSAEAMVARVLQVYDEVLRP